MDFSGLYLKELGCMLDWWLPLEQFFLQYFRKSKNFIRFESKFQIRILISFSRKCFKALVFFFFFKLLFLFKVY